jgi:hypothetical protein
MESFRQSTALPQGKGSHQDGHPLQSNQQRPATTSTATPNPQRPTSAPFALTPPTTAPPINGTTTAPRVSAPVSSRTAGNAGKGSLFLPRPHAQRPTATAVRPPRPANGNGSPAGAAAPNRNAISNAHSRIGANQQISTTNGAKQQSLTNTQQPSTKDSGLTDRMQAAAVARSSVAPTPPAQNPSEYTYEKAMESLARSLMAEKAKTDAIVSQAMGSVAASKLQGTLNGGEKASVKSDSRPIVPLNRNSTANQQSTASSNQPVNQNPLANPSSTVNTNATANPNPTTIGKPSSNPNPTAQSTPHVALQQKLPARAVPSVTEILNMFYPRPAPAEKSSSHSLAQQMANPSSNPIVQPPLQGQSTPPVPAVQVAASQKPAMPVPQAPQPPTQQTSAALANGLRRPATPNQAPRPSTPISNQAPRPVVVSNQPLRSSTPTSNQTPRPAVPSSDQLPRPAKSSVQQNSVSRYFPMRIDQREDL